MSDTSNNEITLESYIAAKKIVVEYEKERLKELLSSRKSRCCGRCDGVNDICVGDMVCEEHGTMGCEICYGER